MEDVAELEKKKLDKALALVKVSREHAPAPLLPLSRRTHVRR